MIDTTQPEVAFAIESVRNAALLGARVKQGLSVQGITKSDYSPVTVADYAIQAYIGKALSDTFSNAMFVAEESSADLKSKDGQEVLGVVTQFVQELQAAATPTAVCDWIDHGTSEPSDRFWTLDPVDGTKGYIRGEQYAIALALIENGKVTLGVLGCPNLDASSDPQMNGEGVLLLAKRGEGAYQCPLQGVGDFTPLKVSGCDDVTRARMMRSVESGHTNTDQIDALAQHMGMQAEPVRMDSQAKYAVLAAGGGEMLFRLLSPKQPTYKERIWDQAAGSIILEEAGGRITDLAGRELDFSQGRKLEANTGVFASNGKLHDIGLEAIQAVCPVD